MKQPESVGREKQPGPLSRQMPVGNLALGAALLLPLGFLVASSIPNANSAPRAPKQAAAQHLQPNAQRQEGVARPRFASTFRTPTPAPTATPTPTPTPATCSAF